MTEPCPPPGPQSGPPRYCPWRTLPRAAYVPGHSAPESRPASEDADEPWDGQARTLPRCAGYLWGLDLFNHGYYWEAHEAWEPLWKQAPLPSTSRMFLQGLIQCAAACLKASTDDWEAGRRLADKGLTKLGRVIDERGERYQGISLRQFCEQMKTYLDDRSSRGPVPALEQNAEPGAGA